MPAELWLKSKIAPARTCCPDAYTQATEPAMSVGAQILRRWPLGLAARAGVPVQHRQRSWCLTTASYRRLWAGDARPALQFVPQHWSKLPRNCEHGLPATARQRCCGSMPAL